MVNNAGVMGEKEGWRLCMDINLKGVLHGATLAVEKMGEGACKKSIGLLEDNF